MKNFNQKSFLRLAASRFFTTKPVTVMILVVVLCFIMGALSGPAVMRAISANEAIAQKQVPPFPMAWRMGSNLYMQTAAEYRACCLQIYACAERRLEAILHAKPLAFPKPAMVMDLDETILDNSAFQTFLYQNNLEYTEALWDVYEKDYPHEVTLVPGAKDFIAKAESNGVTIVYISNRSEKNRQSTIKALEQLGINTANINERLLLKKKGESSDKSARREEVALRYNILLYIGDNLRDFSEAFAAAKLRSSAAETNLTEIERRYAAVDSAASHWGVDWFILPNPVYGEWEKLLGDQPRLKLRATKMNLTGK
jgi:5'-nucleotidase (lipoprotein e(P4) family)